VNVAIVGCGRAGRKRAAGLGACRLVCCADVVPDRAEELARLVPGARWCPDWHEAVASPGVEMVIVATSHDALAEITRAAIVAGKHVLVEKPAACSTVQLEPVIEAAKSAQGLVRVGFNHRFHPALRKARELVDGGAVGELMYVRGRYGHGGRLGYEREWRSAPAASGGGELVDQGVHLIDLARWFLGDFSVVQGRAQRYYWDMPVEDNGFMLLTTPARQVAFLHVSWTEWVNLFSFEIFGRSGKIEVSGLGGSYGPERVVLSRLRPEMGVPEQTRWEYPGPDLSWQLELAEFVADIELSRTPRPGLEDARAALKIAESVRAGTDP
jgi:predicted dehydrogenase